MTAEQGSKMTCPSCGSDVDLAGRDQSPCPKCGALLRVDDTGNIRTDAAAGEAIKGEERTGVPGAGDGAEPPGHP